MGYVPYGLVDNKSALTEELAWHRTRNKSLRKEMIIQRDKANQNYVQSLGSNASFVIGDVVQ